jgi:hypothetical protein
MADDYRIVVEFEEEGHGLHFGRLLTERQFEKDVREQLGDGVLVTRDGPHVFLYTNTREQATAAAKTVQQVLDEDELRATVSPVHRWDPSEDRWEDAITGEEAESEREQREEQPSGEDGEPPYAEWEVRADFPSHGEAVDFAERLEAEGITPITRRWKYVLIGTATEDDANALAERLRGEAPPGATVRAEPSATIAWEVASGNPFSLFGGFGPRP